MSEIFTVARCVHLLLEALSPKLVGYKRLARLHNTTVAPIRRRCADLAVIRSGLNRVASVHGAVAGRKHLRGAARAL
jgi:hypothetical protein